MTEYVNHPLSTFYYETLNWCGCGAPDEAMTFMRDVLAAMNKRSEENIASTGLDNRENSPWAVNSKALKALVDSETMLGLSYLYMLDGYGLTEHGGYIGGSWLTDKGKHILKIMQDSDIELAMSDYPFTEEEFFVKK
jgi:hypothetical protein